MYLLTDDDGMRLWNVKPPDCTVKPVILTRTIPLDIKE